MSALASEQILRYPFPSRCEGEGHALTLRLATCTVSDDASPFFFEGRLASPKNSVALLKTLMDVVQSRFHIPPAMLGRILGESDPVVTANDDRLRFEGFSACCGAIGLACKSPPESFRIIGIIVN
ncbi:MAG: hypothetical protein KDB27_11905 [Planctomycetales bacterium]|nr:hypothetical protein [Planctomycetales bacterium]